MSDLRTKIFFVSGSINKKDSLCKDFNVFCEILSSYSIIGVLNKLCKEKGYEIKVGKFPFTASGKAQAGGHTDGFVKVIFDAKYGEWLGCHMIGAGVTDMIAEAVVGRKLETTGHEILKAVHPHPTMSEAVMEAVAAAYDEVIHV